MNCGGLPQIVVFWIVVFSIAVFSLVVFSIIVFSFVVLSIVAFSSVVSQLLCSQLCLVGFGPTPVAPILSHSCVLLKCGRGFRSVLRWVGINFEMADLCNVNVLLELVGPFEHMCWELGSRASRGSQPGSEPGSKGC